MDTPKLNVYNTSANPLMIIGILLFCAPFFLMAVNKMSQVVSYIFFIIGGLFFIIGLVMYIAENY